MDASIFTSNRSLFLVVDSDTTDFYLPRLIKLIDVPSPPTADGGTSDVVSDNKRHLLLALHRDVFDADARSHQNYRVKRAAFAFQLDNLQKALQKQLQTSIEDVDDLRKVLPVHCMTSGYLQVSQSPTSDTQFQPEARPQTDESFFQYTRGFLIVLPFADAVSAAATNLQPEVQRLSLTEVRSSIDRRTQRLIDVVKAHDFQLIYHLTSDIDSGKWNASAVCEKSMIYSQSETTLGHPNEETMPQLTLVELTGPERDACTRLHPAFRERCNNVVFHQMSEVRDTLVQAKEFADKDAVDELLQHLETCEKMVNDSDPNSPSNPFIVVEGLDATGKSTVVSSLVSCLNASQLYSPPTSIQYLRSSFDAMPAVVRRAYYSLGNYVVGQTARQMTSQTAVVLDRYWPSTAAYAIAEESSIPEDRDHWVYRWPSDLFKPTVVILLVVGEQQRMQRIQGRQVTTGTLLTREERQLAVDEGRRRRILDAYRRISDPAVIEVSAEGSPEEVLTRVVDVLRSKNVL